MYQKSAIVLSSQKQCSQCKAGHWHLSRVAERHPTRDAERHRAKQQLSRPSLGLALPQAVEVGFRCGWLVESVAAAAGWVGCKPFSGGCGVDPCMPGGRQEPGSTHDCPGRQRQTGLPAATCLQRSSSSRSSRRRRCRRRRSRAAGQRHSRHIQACGVVPVHDLIPAGGRARWEGQARERVGRGRVPSMGNNHAPCTDLGPANITWLPCQPAPTTGAQCRTMPQSLQCQTQLKGQCPSLHGSSM